MNTQSSSIGTSGISNLSSTIALFITETGDGSRELRNDYLKHVPWRGKEDRNKYMDKQLTQKKYAFQSLNKNNGKKKKKTCKGNL